MDRETEHRLTKLEVRQDSTDKKVDGWEKFIKNIIKKLLALFVGTIVTGLTLGLHSESARKAWMDLWGGK